MGGYFEVTQDVLLLNYTIQTLKSENWKQTTKKLIQHPPFQLSEWGRALPFCNP